MSYDAHNAYAPPQRQYHDQYHQEAPGRPQQDGRQQEYGQNGYGYDQYDQQYDQSYGPPPSQARPRQQPQYDNFNTPRDHQGYDYRPRQGPPMQGNMTPHNDRAYDQRYQQRPRDQSYNQGSRQQRYPPDHRPPPQGYNGYGDQGGPRDGYGPDPRARGPRNDQYDNRRPGNDGGRQRGPPNGAYGPRPSTQNGGQHSSTDDWKVRERAKMNDAKSPDMRTQDNAFPSFANGGRETNGQARHGDSRSPPVVNGGGAYGRPPPRKNPSQESSYTQDNGQYRSDKGRPSLDSRSSNYSRNRGYSDYQRQRPPPDSGYGSGSHDEYAMPPRQDSSAYQNGQYPSRQLRQGPSQGVAQSYAADPAADHARGYAAEISHVDRQPLSPSQAASHNAQQYDQRSQGPSNGFSHGPGRDAHVPQGTYQAQYGSAAPTSPSKIHPSERGYSPSALQAPKYAQPSPHQAVSAPTDYDDHRQSLDDLYDDYHADAGPIEQSVPQTREEQIGRDMPNFDNAPPSQQKLNGTNGSSNAGPRNFSAPIQKQAPSITGDACYTPPPSAPFANEQPVRSSLDDVRQLPIRSTPQGRYGPPNPQRFYDIPRAGTAPPAQQTTSANLYGPSTSVSPPAENLARPPPVRNYDNPGTPLSDRPPPVRQHQPEAEVAMPTDHQRQLSTDEEEKPVTLAEISRLREVVAANPGNPKQGLRLAKKLAEAADVLANEGGRADVRTTNKNREKFLDEALKRVKKLVAQGYPESQFYLADCHGSGELGLEVDSREAFALYQAAAKQGHAQAAYRTAVCCEIGAEEGGGTRRDYAKAVQWYRRASALGDVAAMYKLGIILLRAMLGQPRNAGEGINWLKRAAERADPENPHAIHELATLYESSNRDQDIRNKLVADDNHARELYQQGAKMGFKASQFRLGQAYEYGQLGLNIDNRSSIAWYSKAAAQGEHQAELALSGWYLTGAEGILDQSDTEAYLWARKAASSEPPQPKAMFAMGYFSEQGIGCPANPDEARRWYGRAASYKFPKAVERLEELKRSSKGRLAPVSGKLNRKDQKKDESECVVM